MDDVFISKILMNYQAYGIIKGMTRLKRGFTLIEVSIFLALTGLLFIGVVAGVQNSVYQQQRSDSVQNFVEFLRSVYSGVENVQNAVPEGRSEQAIYGKLVTFGESYDLAGEETDGKKAFVYTVVGNVGSGSDSTLALLAKLKANVVAADGNLAGYPETYSPKWGAVIEKAGELQNVTPLSAALLVVRNPDSGVIYTFYRSGTIEVNKTRKTNWGTNNPFTSALTDGSFKLVGTGELADGVDFCINPTGTNMATNRTDIRITGARNASGIMQVAETEANCGATR